MIIFYFYYKKINSTKKQQLQFLLPFVAFSRHITSFEVNISNMSYDGTNSSSPFFILCINNTHNAQRQRIKKPTKKWKPKSRFHHAIDAVLIFNKIKGKIFPTPFGYKLSRKVLSTWFWRWATPYAGCHFVTHCLFDQRNDSFWFCVELFSEKCM